LGKAFHETGPGIESCLPTNSAPWTLSHGAHCKAPTPEGIGMGPLCENRGQGGPGRNELHPGRILLVGTVGGHTSLLHLTCEYEFVWWWS
jgi:hypothetical protein